MIVYLVICSPLMIVFSVTFWSLSSDLIVKDFEKSFLNQVFKPISYKYNTKFSHGELLLRTGFWVVLEQHLKEISPCRSFAAPRIYIFFRSYHKLLLSSCSGFGWGKVNFFSVAGTVLGFGFSMRTMLITHRRWGCWYAVLTLSQGRFLVCFFFCLMLCHWGGT